MHQVDNRLEQPGWKKVISEDASEGEPAAAWLVTNTMTKMVKIWQRKSLTRCESIIDNMHKEYVQQFLKQNCNSLLFQ